VAPTQRISDAMEEVDVVYTSDVFGLAHVMPPLWHAHRTVPPCSRSEKTSQHLAQAYRPGTRAKDRGAYGR